MPKLLREYTFREQNSGSDGTIVTPRETAIMQLQGELKGRAAGTPSGLTDLFTHLSHVEHSPGLVAILQSQDEALIGKLLDTYQLPPEIKAHIIEYVRNPSQTTVDKIKDDCAQEVQKIWEILGVC